MAERMPGTLQEKLEQAHTTLRSFGRAVVAFSGGVDSTLLAKLSRDVLGKANALAVTADSPSMARADLEETKRLAHALDLDHLIVTTKEVQDPRYRLNTEARCYFCKHELFEELAQLAATRQIPVVLYGVIGDDRLDERPGHRAALEFGVRAPLQEAGFAKWEVREAAKRFGLPNWDRPQNACLSSRIPHGIAVTEARLRQIEQAEATLRDHGFLQIRVRYDGRHARIEVGQQEVVRFEDPALCAELTRAFGALGFESVGIDRRGYQLGGANHSSVEEFLLV